MQPSEPGLNMTKQKPGETDQSLLVFALTSNTLHKQKNRLRSVSPFGLLLRYIFMMSVLVLKTLMYFTSLASA